MQPPIWETLLAIAGGIGLAAACGFRVFVPLLLMAIGTRAGVLDLAPGFDWLSSTPAIIAISVACVLEVSAYYVPWLDHALDTIAAPAAVVAGSFAMASQVGVLSSSPDVDWLRWIVGILAGGSVAGLVQVGTMLTRGISTLTTLGLANPVVSTAELGVAALAALLAIFIPLLALFVAIALVVLTFALLMRRRKSQPIRRIA